jgi:hypothetical protein
MESLQPRIIVAKDKSKEDQEMSDDASALAYDATEVYRHLRDEILWGVARIAVDTSPFELTGRDPTKPIDYPGLRTPLGTEEATASWSRMLSGYDRNKPSFVTADAGNVGITSSAFAFTGCDPTKPIDHLGTRTGLGLGDTTTSLSKLLGYDPYRPLSIHADSEHRVLAVREDRLRSH